VPDKLWTLDDIGRLASADLKKLLRQCTVIARIYSFLEDLNVVPIKHLPVKFNLGQNRRTHIFHASTVGNMTGSSLCGRYKMGCARLLYYDLVGAEAEGAWEPRMRSLLDTGSAIHAQLQAYLEEVVKRSEGVESFEPEATIDPDNNDIADRMDLSGHTDGIYQIVTPDMELRFGLEIKTINAAGYEKTSSPHPEHLTQGTVYQKCLDLPVMVFLYYNKNDSSVAEYAHVYDPRHWDAIVRKLDWVREHAMREEPPERENGWHCSNCKYKKICKPPRRTRGPNARVKSAFRKSKEG
jgi:CRISPR/Cas system-associated exonuclease Cas4 (RecB family)